jgi:hypothetical protein
MDTAGPEAARPHIEAAAPEHPSLIDAGHSLGELVGIVNVPMALWIDETGTIVRGPEVAYVGKGGYEAPKETPKDLPPAIQELIDLVRGIQVPRGYVDALRDWVTHGAASRYALDEAEVLARSRPRPFEVAEAAACFDLGQHLWRAGHTDEAVPWFREAHRLQPDNWTYRRQAWTFADPHQRKTDLYEGSWADDIRASGPANYYDRIPDIAY